MVQSNLLHVSMDDPNVNWAFFSELRNYRAENNMTKLLTTGSCVIHSIRGAFKTGENKADWNVKKLLKALHQILFDTPARRADYTDVTRSQNFPLHLVVHDGLRMKRWQLKRLIFGKTYVSDDFVSQCQKASRHLVKLYDRVICFQRSSYFGRIAFLHLHRWYHEVFSDTVRTHEAHDTIFV